MKQNKDWTNVMRSALRDAELPPPADGWSRLERELGGVQVRPVPVWRSYWPRIAAAAAAVLICVAGGEFLWHENLKTETDGVVIVTAADSGAAAQVGIPAKLEVVPEITGSQLAVAVPVPLRPIAVPKTVGQSEQKVNQVVVNQEPVAADTQSRQETHQEARQTETPEAKPGTARKAETTSKQQSTAGMSPRSYFADEKFVAYTPPREKMSFGAFVAGGVTGSTTSTGLVSRTFSDLMETGRPGLSVLPRIDYREGSFRHHQPLSFGLTVRKELPYKLSLESGVIYTLLWSDVTTSQGSEEFSQKLHYIGVPLRLNWNFYERKSFRLYIGAGGMVEKCVSAKFGTESVEEPGVQWSAMAALGAEYRLGKVVGFYFEPDLSYYFTQTTLRTSRTDSPLTFTLRLGVRLSF